MARLDLVKLIEILDVHTEPDSEHEIQARLEGEKAELRQRLHIQLVTFYALGVLYVLTFGAAFCIAVTSQAELQKWSMSIVTLLAGALVGYLTGRQSK